jgi:ISXO2-like transposase domain
VGDLGKKKPVLRLCGPMMAALVTINRTYWVTALLLLWIDEFYIGGAPKKKRDEPPPGRGRRGLRKTLKTPALIIVQRPDTVIVGAPAGDARASVVADLSQCEADGVLEKEVAPEAHLMSDEWKAFVAAGQDFAAHSTVQHSRQEYVRGDVHANSAEGFNSRVRRTVAGVFHHISSQHADLYFHEIGFRWSQRIVSGQAARVSRNGRKSTRTHWTRVPPALQPTASLPGCGGARNAPWTEGRHHHQIKHCCLWFIKAAYDFEQRLF